MIELPPACLTAFWLDLHQTVSLAETPNEKKAEILSYLMERQDYHCAYCGEEFDPDHHPTIDHIVPRAEGGSSELENLCAACWPCNAAKADKVAHRGHYYRPLAKLKEIIVDP